jgi:hypothetical protein
VITPHSQKQQTIKKNPQYLVTKIRKFRHASAPCPFEILLMAITNIIRKKALFILFVYCKLSPTGATPVVNTDRPNVTSNIKLAKWNSALLKGRVIRTSERTARFAKIRFFSFKVSKISIINKSILRLAPKPKSYEYESCDHEKN